MLGGDFLTSTDNTTPSPIFPISLTILSPMYRYHPQAIRDFFVKYQDRILFGTDGSLIAEPKHLDDGKR